MSTSLDAVIAALAEQIAAKVAEQLAAKAPAAAPTADAWLTTVQAAALLSQKPITLEIWRTKGVGPAYSKPSRSVVRYRKSALDEWMARNDKPRKTRRAP